MATQTRSFKDVYTRKVGGEKYDYEVKYSPGERVEWRGATMWFEEWIGNSTHTLEGIWP